MGYCKDTRSRLQASSVHLHPTKRDRDGVVFQGSGPMVLVDMGSLGKGAKTRQKSCRL